MSYSVKLRTLLCVEASEIDCPATFRHYQDGRMYDSSESYLQLEAAERALNQLECRELLQFLDPAAFAHVCLLFISPCHNARLLSERDHRLRCAMCQL
jgi:hypothetical protein